MKLRQALGFILLFVLCLILTAMGIWQINRAKVKQNILDEVAKSTSMMVLDCQNLEHPKPWQKCKIQGQLRPERFYLDNQFHGHELGYHILGLIQLSAGPLLMVDMGWQALGSNRQHLPQVQLPNNPTWIGQVYYPSPVKFKLGDLVDKQEANHYVIERLDLVGIAQILHQPILPWVLRMSLQQKTGLKQEWQLVSVGPERHYAYALQWFTMAAIVLGILIVWMIKRCKRKT